MKPFNYLSSDIFIFSPYYHITGNFSGFLHPYFVSIFGLKWRHGDHTVVINRNRLLRYKLCAISIIFMKSRYIKVSENLNMSLIF